MKKKMLTRALSAAAGVTMVAANAAAQETGVAVQVEQAEQEAKTYVGVANVQGNFNYNQNVLTPPDEVFNLFGTVLTAACARPAFAMSKNDNSYYINVGGHIKETFVANLANMKDSEQEQTMLCACATGPATANVSIKGIPVEEIVQLADIDEDVNAISLRGGEGYTTTLPLRYAMEKKAMLVYSLGDTKLPSGTQLFVPETVAKYFTRDVVDIELTHVDDLAEIEQRDDALRAEIVVKNETDGQVFAKDAEIAFEGYADDLGEPIAAVEFSLDGGETWTAYETKNATADKWVYWHFGFTPKAEGSYQLSVRARTTSGKVSPLAASVTFDVAEQQEDRAV